MIHPLPRPAQSRLLTYAFSFSICLTFFASILPSHRAIAAELSPTIDHLGLREPNLNAPTTGEVTDNVYDDIDENGSGSYAPEFAPFDRSLLGRQAADQTPLKDKEMQEMDINPGSTLHFVFESSSRRIRRAQDVAADALDNLEVDDLLSGTGLENESIRNDDEEAEEGELKKRQATSNRIFISANTCRQPTHASNGTSSSENHPQLVMYISTSGQNTKPGPDSTQNTETGPAGLIFDGGFASFEVNDSSTVYIGISAPRLDQGMSGSYHFEIAASTENSHHRYNSSNPFLFMVDTDSDSALFITNELGTSNETDVVDMWKLQNPFKMYAFEEGERNSVTGLEHSFCALKAEFSSNSTKNFTIDTSVTTKFGPNSRLGRPKSQFHVQDLESATTYIGFIVVEENDATSAIDGLGAVTSGGQVFKQFNWTTKSDDSCQVLFDLEFCDTVAYAVPSSPEFKGNDSKLAKVYDDQAKELYKNFENSLAQIACDTTSEAQYSLARNCTDCARDYKSWLCAVLIPRCEDFSVQQPWLQDRRINIPFANGSVPYAYNTSSAFERERKRFGFNQSRNALIDEQIKPGPYKELLPCDDLCIDIVRSCPAKLGFACPDGVTKRTSYGTRPPPGEDDLTCNFPGAVKSLNNQGAAGTLSVSQSFVGIIAMLVAFSLV